MPKKKSLAVAPLIERQIHLIRGQKVMLDRDLAHLYGVRPIALRQQVKRNLRRFPSDFAFVLTRQEVARLLSQSVIGPRKSLGGSLPYVFTEHGVAMLSSVLRSDRAVDMNIAIVRAFVRLRELIAANKDLAERIDKLEANQSQHASIINLLVEEIDAMKALPPPPERRIGFQRDPVET